MKKLIFYFTFIFSLTAKSQSWTALPTFPGVARYEAVSFVIGNKFYVGTGRSSTITRQRDFYSFDLLTETWAPIAFFKAGDECSGATAFSTNTFGYVYGGRRYSGYFNTLKRYNPANNTWKYMTPFPSLVRIYASSFVINNEAYIIGGTLPSLVFNEVWKYSIQNNSWQQMNSTPFQGLSGAASCSINGTGYLFGGIDSNLDYNNILYSYDANLDLWSPLDTFPGLGRAFHKMEVIGNDLVIFGGFNDANNQAVYYDDLWMYHFSNQTFIQYNSLPALARRQFVACVWNNNFYMSTGRLSTNGNTIETWKSNLIVGLNNLNPEEISIYPNPFIDEIRINKEGEFFVTDLSGRRVVQGLIENNSINLKNLSCGVYILTIIDNKEKMFASKITKLN